MSIFFAANAQNTQSWELHNLASSKVELMIEPAQLEQPAACQTRCHEVRDFYAEMRRMSITIFDLSRKIVFIHGPSWREKVLDACLLLNVQSTIRALKMKQKQALMLRFGL